MATPKVSIFTKEEVESIHHSSLKLLETVGIVIESKEIQKLLKDAGATVDASKNRVRIPSSLTEEYVRKAPREYSRGDQTYGSGDTYFMPISGLMKMVDIDTGVYRETRLKDVEDFARVIDALDYDSNQFFTYPNDVYPAKARQVYALEAILRNTYKGTGAFANDPEILEYMIQLAAADVGGLEELRKRGRVSFALSPDSPLCYTAEVADQIVKLARLGLPMTFVPMPMPGATGPVTLAGSIMQANAETLAGILIAELVNPGTPVLYLVNCKAIDMKSGVDSEGIEYGLIGCAVAPLAEYYNLPCVAVGYGTSSSAYDEQAGFEKALSLLLIALSRPSAVAGAGKVEIGRTGSFEQLVIDDELTNIVRRTLRGIGVSDQSLALDVISEVGPSPGNFLAHKHTRQHFKEELYMTKICNRDRQELWEEKGSKRIEEVARAKAKQVLKEHWPKPHEEDTLKEFKKILDDAGKNLA